MFIGDVWTFSIVLVCPKFVNCFGRSVSQCPGEVFETRFRLFELTNALANRSSAICIESMSSLLTGAMPQTLASLSVFVTDHLRPEIYHNFNFYIISYYNRNLQQCQKVFRLKEITICEFGATILIFRQSASQEIK